LCELNGHRVTPRWNGNCCNSTRCGNR
jgi:hypothetical protein